MTTSTPPPRDDAGSVKPDAGDATYQELLWPLVLQGNAIGRLEWSTGVLSLDVDSALFDRLGTEIPAESPGAEFTEDERRTAIATLTHEQIHVLQIGMCGFPYRWAAELFDHIRPALSRLRDDAGREDFGPLLAAIDLGEDAFSTAERGALTRHFEQLDEPSPTGITTRSILETHAFVIQRMINYGTRTYADLEPHLNDAPAPEYRAAMDVLVLAVGAETAYPWFPLVCSVALCSERPAAAFNKILLSLAAYPGVLPDAPTRENALQSQRDLADIVGDQLIGSAGEVASTRGDVGTPHVRLVNGANEAFNSGAAAPSWAYAAPHEELGELIAHLRVPIFLRPQYPQGFAAQLPPGMDEGTGLAQLTLAAISSQLCQTFDAASRELGAQALDGLDWLRADRRAILLRLDADQIARHDHGPLLNLSDPTINGQRPGRQLARAWGRGFLLGPEELDPDGTAALALVPSISAYLRELNATFPAFPIVLSFTSGRSSFVDWFGSIAPAACVGGELRLDHPDIVDAIAVAVSAIEDLGRQVGQNPTLALQLMQLPVWMAEG
jgi:hypothetical protein